MSTKTGSGRFILLLLPILIIVFFSISATSALADMDDSQLEGNETATAKWLTATAIAASKTPEAKPTDTPIPPTDTPEPTPTKKVEPTPTKTVEPTPTDTPVPPTKTVEPTPTDTPVPPTKTPEPTPTDPAGGEGCTPGYWRQEHHFDSWVGYLPTDTFDSVFGVDSSFGEHATLYNVVRIGGGGERAMGRHAVAALLNASSDVSYAYSVSQVISMVQDAYASGNFEATKNLFEAQNEAGCPLN